MKLNVTKDFSVHAVTQRDTFEITPVGWMEGLESSVYHLKSFCKRFINATLNKYSGVSFSSRKKIDDFGNCQMSVVISAINNTTYQFVQEYERNIHETNCN